MTATLELEETFAIVKAPGTTSTRATNRLGRPMNRQGFTIIPHLDPFIGSWLDFDPQGLNGHMEIVSSNTMVVSDSGVAVKAKFVTRTDYPWLTHVTLPDGAALPLGAEVFDDSSRTVGVVGQGGLLYARVPQTGGGVSVVRSERSGQRCRLAYVIHGDVTQQVSHGTPHQIYRPGTREK